jgi:hypothetical protein
MAAIVRDTSHPRRAGLVLNGYFGEWRTVRVLRDTGRWPRKQTCPEMFRYCNLNGSPITRAYSRDSASPVCSWRTSSPNWNVAAGRKFWIMRQ